jgi:Holliday junction resolvase RusA-like endonuclease
MIKLSILGEPKAQKRHRHVKMGNFVRQYDPSASDKGDFLSVIQRHAPEEPFLNPLYVKIDFYFSRPKSHYRTGKNSHELKDNAPLHHTSKPDVDNLAKFVMDAMNKIYWKDDSFISSCHITKYYSRNPRTEIEIFPIDYL